MPTFSILLHIAEWTQDRTHNYYYTDVRYKDYFKLNGQKIRSRYVNIPKALVSVNGSRSGFNNVFSYEMVLHGLQGRYELIDDNFLIDGLID